MPQPADSVLRLDFATLRGGQQTPQGFYRFDAAIGRAGVVKYRLPDGSVVRELRPPDEVFSLDAMQSAWGAVLTDKHPPAHDARIHPGNVKQYQIGWCGDSVRRDGNKLIGNVVVEDGAIISLIANGDRREISPGYFCVTDPTPGRWDGKNYGPDVEDGEEYDCVQRRIRMNHIGLGPSGWGRQGSEVGLVLDGECEGIGVAVSGTNLGDFIKLQMQLKGMTLIDLAIKTGIIRPADEDYAGDETDPLLRQGSSRGRTSILEDILEGYTDRPSDEQLGAIAEALDLPVDSLIQRLPQELQKLDSHQLELAMPNENNVTLKLDGIDIELPKGSAAFVQRAIADRDTKIGQLTAKVEKAGADLQAAQGRLDAANVELEKTKVELAAAPEKVRAAAQARAKLEGDARNALGSNFKTDGLSDRQIREAVVNAWAPELKLDGKGDEYLAPLFDAALAKLPKQSASSAVMGAAFGGPEPRARLDAGADLSRETNPAAERADMTARHANQWRGKASA